MIRRTARTSRAAPLAALALACSSSTVVVAVRNLERPTDMTFVCLERVGDLVSARPMHVCHPHFALDPAVDLRRRPRVMGTFGLATNTLRGELHVVDLNRGALLDLDPAQPGYGTLPVGTAPERIASSQDGCLAVTANRGSCDLSVVDTSRLFAPVLEGAPSTGGGAAVRSVVPVTAGGDPLRAAPAEVVFLPQALQDVAGAVGLCAADAAFGGTAPEGQPQPPPRPWRALVTFPACDLVALLDLPSGDIVDSVYVRETGIVPAGQTPTCPAECGPASAGSPAPLAIAALELTPDGRRAYVGGAAAPFVSVLDVTEDRLAGAASGARIDLAEGPVGVTRLRLSVDPYAAPETADGGPGRGRFLGRRGHFLYVFARDGSVRVVDVTRAPGRECDVNVELAPDDIPGRACAPVAVGLPRHPLALGPGLRLPPAVSGNPANAVVSAIATDVAFLDFALPDQARRGFLEGTFGFLIGSDGAVYVLDVDPAARLDESAPPPAHRIRNYNVRPPGELGHGGARAVLAQARDFSVKVAVPFPTAVNHRGLAGPRLEIFETRDPADDPVVAATGVPQKLSALVLDRERAQPQTWTITWEGTLMGRMAGLVRPGSGGMDAGSLEDPGAAFCASGVLPGDVLRLAGCLRDADCGPPAGLACQQPAPGEVGVCVPAGKLKDASFQATCGRLLASRRRYTVARAAPTTLALAPRLDEVPRPSIRACTQDADCRPDDAHGPLRGVTHDRGFECVIVRAGEPGRCVKRCGALDADGNLADDGAARNDVACRPGHVCEDVGADPGVGPLCVEAPPLDPRCFAGEVRYQVHAGAAFLVAGSATNSYPIGREAGGACVADPSRDPRLAQRIPLAAPPCANVPDGSASLDAIHAIPAAAGGAWGNPCLFSAPNGDDGDAATSHVKALYQNTELRILLTNLEAYVGDAASIRFQVSGGYVPMAALSPFDLRLTLGTRILVGPVWSPSSPGVHSDGRLYPFPYLFVIDQGRGTSPGSRGQILRLNPQPSEGVTQSSPSVPIFDSLQSRRSFLIQ